LFVDSSAPWWDLFANVPVPIQVVFWLVLLNTLLTFVSVITLSINSLRFTDRRRREIRPLSEKDFLWVFLVPALNEEVTIADSVQRLRDANASNKVLLVINDGSDDRTGEILAAVRDPALQVLTRAAPNARLGKSAALNDAYRYLLETVLTSAQFASWPAERVIVCVVDADGRLDPDAPDAVAWHFAESRMGGVQTLVRIYNRRTFLTWAQDVEFGSFGLVYQNGRSWWGSANMGGNGQFNRLSALQEIADSSGPWRDRLTEDQDLGVRLIQNGWLGAQENSVSINQQGLRSLRRLYRQRTRWAQGSWQAFSLLGGVGRPRQRPLARIDALYYLLTPALQLLTGVGLVAALVISIIRDVPFWPGSVLIAIIFVTLGFGPGLITQLFRARSFAGVLVAILVVLPYVVYSWLVFPVLALALIRQSTGGRSWAKTEREPLAVDPPT
jgi:1,2-diacylglycerol 3-beta-glucosyltransferase